MGQLLYLSASAIAELALSPDEVRESVESVFRESAAKKAWSPPKTTISLGPGHFLQTLVAARHDPPVGAAKFLAVCSTNADKGLPNVHSLIVLNDTRTGKTLAIMDGQWITAVRTAAMTGLAAKRLAAPDSESIGFVGAGSQALAHLIALPRVLPRLREATVFSRSLTSARRFIEAARALGLEGRIAEEPSEPAACDVVVTTVPASPELEPFMDARWLRPGAFVSAVDLGRSWRPEGLECLNFLATDDHEQSNALSESGKLTRPRAFDADLSQLALASDRLKAPLRSMFIFSGSGLADLAVAELAYKSARARGVGLAVNR